MSNRKWLVEEIDYRYPKKQEYYLTDQGIMDISRIDFYFKEYPILRVTEITEDNPLTDRFDEFNW